jgi:hypothetical protein
VTAMENQRVNIDGREERLNLAVWALASQSLTKTGKDSCVDLPAPLALKLEGNIVKSPSPFFFLFFFFFLTPLELCVVFDFLLFALLATLT